MDGKVDIRGRFTTDTACMKELDRETAPEPKDKTQPSFWGCTDHVPRIGASGQLLIQGEESAKNKDPLPCVALLGKPMPNPCLIMPGDST